MVSQPLIGVVVVNYFGGERTIRCLEAVLRSTWPADRLRVVLVDNGSEPGFRDRLGPWSAAVDVVVPGANLGFGGACNLGFERLSHCDHIAVLNNDAAPEPGWLEPMVDVLHERRRVGAVAPKVLLAQRYVRLSIRSPTTRPGGGDARDLGVQLCGARVDGVDVTDGIQLVNGFWGWEHDDTPGRGIFTWSSANATALVPVPGDGGRCHLEVRLAAGTGARDVEVGTGPSGTLAVDVAPAWHDLGNAGPASEILNSCGTTLRDDGLVVDAGFLEPDDGQFDEPREVFGWSGAAALLRRAYLEDVGAFDPAYFLYFEDTDLAWRGRLRGWSHWYEPTSIVRHEHSATIGERSPLVRHLFERNRLLMLTKCAPADDVATAVKELVTRLVTTSARDLVIRPLRGRPPIASHALAIGRILAGYVELLPHALRERRRIAGRAVAAATSPMARADRVRMP